MGRAQGTKNAVSVVRGGGRSGSRHVAAAQTVSLTVAQLNELDRGYSAPGEEIALASHLEDGEERTFVLEEGDLAAGIVGLDLVRNVQVMPNGHYIVSFHDGQTAAVDLDGNAVSLSAGDNFDNAHLAGALYAAMGHKALYATDTNDLDNPLNKLGDLWSEKLNADSPDTDPVLLAELAAAAHEQLETSGAPLTVNSPELSRMLVPQQAAKPSRTVERELMARWQQQMARLRQTLSPEEGARAAAMSLLFPFDPATGQLVGLPTQDMRAEYAAAADRLGIAVPELKIQMDDDQVSIGDFEVGPSEKERFDLIRNELAVGGRAFAFRGPPGSGKDASAEQLAALLGRGLYPINLGTETDIEMYVGGDGLSVKEAEYEEPLTGPTGKFLGIVEGKQVELEPKVDPEDGYIICDKDAVPILLAPDGKTEIRAVTTKRKQSSTASTTLIGPIAKGAQEPVVMVFQEPRNMDPASQRLNAMIGNNSFDPNGRYININASAAGVERKLKIPVNPDCVMVFTYNAGEEDNRLHTSTHDRMLNLDFDYPSREAQCKRYATIINRAMRDPELDIPDGLRREWSPETFEPIIGVVEKLRNASRDNPSFIDEPGDRTGQRLFMQLILQAWYGDSRADRTAKLILDHCRSYNEKFTSATEPVVTQILSDEGTALTRFADAIYQEGQKANAGSAE